MVCSCVFCVLFEELAFDDLRRKTLPEFSNEGHGPTVIVDFCKCSVCLMLTEINAINMRSGLQLETSSYNSSSSSISMYESARSHGFTGLEIEIEQPISFNARLATFAKIFIDNKRTFIKTAFGIMILLLLCFFVIPKITQTDDDDEVSSIVNNSSRAPTTTTTQQTTNTSTHTVPTQQATKSTGLVQTFKHTNDDFSVTFTQQATQFEPNDRISSTKTPTTQRATTKFDVDGIPNKI